MSKEKSVFLAITDQEEHSESVVEVIDMTSLEEVFGGGRGSAEGGCDTVVANLM